MTHSHDRTLLAKLGFQDPDKKDRRHAMACAFLGQEDVSVSVVSHVIKNSGGVVLETSVEFESPLSKGDGQYKTTIGFIDLDIDANVWRKRDGGRSVIVNDDGSEVRGVDVRYQIPVEVKIKKIGVDDCIRQVNLYREYYTKRCGRCPECEFTERVVHGRGGGMVFGYSVGREKERQCSKVHVCFVLATYFDIAIFEKEMLENSNIHHIRLGSGFERFMSEQQQ